MSDPSAPTNLEAPQAKSIIRGVLIGLVIAAIVLVTFILPAEYGRDPTGIGTALGITNLSVATRTIEISDNIGGNDSVRDAEIPDFGDPVPLPNPAVHQGQDSAPKTRTLEVSIPAEAETEIKMALGESKVIVYTWQADRGTIYSDFHGHNPEFGDQFFVRYHEHQEGSGGTGSLVAPFDGEHGWYWLNYNEYPVTVTLTVTGYFNDMIDYGIF